MHLLARVSVVVGLLALPAVAIADDNATVTDPRMQPPPGSPPPAGQPPVAGEPPPAGQPAVQPLPPQQQPVQPVKRTTVGADLGVVIPLGDYADGNDFAIGALLRIAYAATPEVDITFRGGYLWHKTESDSLGLSMIPLLIGGSFKLGGGPFIYGEAGINMIRVSYHAMGISATDGETYLSVGAGGGYQVGKVQARLGFWMPGRPKNANTGDTTTLYGILGSVGFDFNAF